MVYANPSVLPFACLAMVAELSTGAWQWLMYQCSFIHVGSKMEAEYFLKAVGITTFTCTDGLQFRNAVNKAIDGEAQTLSVIRRSKCKWRCYCSIYYSGLLRLKSDSCAFIRGFNQIINVMEYSQLASLNNKGIVVQVPKTLYFLLKS